MITFDESQKSVPLLQRLVLGLAQGGENFARLREKRREDQDAEQKFRIQNILQGGGEVSDADLPVLQKWGLTSRLAPVDAAVAGPKRYKILQSPQQQQQEAAAKRSLQLYQQADEEAQKGQIVGQWLRKQGINPLEDPMTAARAYQIADVEIPKVVMDMINARQSEEAQARMFAQQEDMQSRRTADAIARALQQRQWETEGLPSANLPTPGQLGYAPKR